MSCKHEVNALIFVLQLYGFFTLNKKEKEKKKNLEFTNFSLSSSRGEKNCGLGVKQSITKLIGRGHVLTPKHLLPEPIN